MTSARNRPQKRASVMDIVGVPVTSLQRLKAHRDWSFLFGIRDSLHLHFHGDIHHGNFTDREFAAAGTDLDLLPSRHPSRSMEREKVASRRHVIQHNFRAIY